jgi:hypothetical protein
LLALDSSELLSGYPNERRFQHIAPGSTLPQHRDVLLFAAGEFERISQMPCEEEVRQRLTSKAAWLRARADD